MLVNSSITRGCGKRKEGGLYACVGGGGSMPLEGFIIDPVVPWANGPFQGGIVSYQPATGAWDLILWVGAEYYPYVPDFVEEGRVHGFSKRIPTNLENLDLLSAEESRLVLVHPRAGYDHRHHTKHYDTSHWASVLPRILRPDASASGECNHPIESDHQTTNCTFSLWDLAGHPKATTNRHRVTLREPLEKATMELSIASTQEPLDDDEPIIFAGIETPSVTYEVANMMEGFSPYDRGKDMGWYPAIFGVLPLTHFEYVTADESAIPAEVADKLGDNITRTFTTPT
jgi:hypothetical protein